MDGVTSQGYGGVGVRSGGFIGLVGAVRVSCRVFPLEYRVKNMMYVHDLLHGQCLRRLDFKVLTKTY